MKNIPSVSDLFQSILLGNISALSKGITLIESSLAADQKKSEELIRLAIPKSGNSVRIGITGIPGAGKSSWIEAIGKHFLENNHKLAILTVDPTSQLSKGSILGDKTRMETLVNNPSVFIRPSPSGLTLGGVAKSTRESILLCEAAGYDVIIVETVGVGQSEVAVHAMVDVFLLIAIPGAGDELQGIKRGIMEMADLILINKSDGNNFERAKQAAQQLKNALHLFPQHRFGHEVKVLLCDALSGMGVKESYEELDQLISFFIQNDSFELRRKEQLINWMKETIEEGLLKLFYNDELVQNSYNVLKEKVVKGEMSPYEAGLQILSQIKVSTP